ncbi:zinc finger MIZ domain-containing protein 2-like, partial [Neolamprologus brichardi]|uniref:zinc finger MIZ domain-containing protein 2-like n=1 Tax=Neolamprologus brichardi TaxID=32507 RepID=UPI001643E8D7
ADFTQAAAAAAVAAAAATATATATATVAAIQEKQNQEMNYGQMGGPAYNNQFMAHSGPRGPPGMAPGGMGPGPGPARGPPSMGPMYGPGGGPQRVPQHPNYGPGPQQGHLRPPQGLKRPYSSESFPGMSQQYGVPVGSSVNVMPGPGGGGGSMPGSAGGGHGGPYSGPNMQYHPGPAGPGPAPPRSGSSPSYQSHKMPLPPQYPPSGPPSSQYYKQDQFNGQSGLNTLTAGGAAGVYNSFNQPSGVRRAHTRVCLFVVSVWLIWLLPRLTRVCVCSKTALLEGLEVDQYMLGILIYVQNSEYEEITIDPVCSWKPVPVKPDLHVKEEPDGPVLKRCRTLSPSHMVMPNVMEMIASLGPTPSSSSSSSTSAVPPSSSSSSPMPYPSLPGGGGGGNSSTTPEYPGPGSAPSFPTLSAPFSDFSGPGTPSIGGDFSSPGPPPLSYQSELSSALLTPDKPPPHPLAGQMPGSGRMDSTSHGAPLQQHQQQLQGLHGNSQMGGGNQMMQRSSQNPRLQGDGSFGLGGSADVPETSLDLLPELTNPDELLSYLGPPDLPSNNNDDLLSLFENN